MKNYTSKLTSILNIKYPIILAPMYLVTNEKMVVEACEFGATGAIPAMNWSDTELMRKGIQQIKLNTSKPFGINNITHASNPAFEKQLQVCIDEKVGFIITSLGNPEMTIKLCKPLGIKVFCDVVDARHAKRLEQAGADALIAVNNLAGGHAGQLDQKTLIAALKQEVSIPIISAGGVATADLLADVLNLGVDGVSIGTLFIATHECTVSEEYKNAVINHGASDIVMTDRLSGTPCAVINTPYVQSIGTKQNRFEKFLNRNKRLKRLIKQYAYARGMKMLKKAAFSATYQTVWSAGPSIEYIKEVKHVNEILTELTKDIEFSI
ncbi:MAG: nitronate monooxygenase [Salinivirgaceae bacterium]|nr:nitronate monooxygenase [Salinivirgaceae bacterium]